MMTILWHSSKPLTAASLLMLAALLASGIALYLDPRLITGAPAWLKPAKFAISTAIYMLTLAWILTFLPDWPHLRFWAEWITAVVLVLEVVIIDVQALRGTTSHFNVGRPLDQALFGTMGIAILIAWFASIAITVALFRQHMPDSGLAWALRLGMLITVLGSAVGGFMVRPTSDQLAHHKASGRLMISGSHTVGAPDGGPGMPGTGWSREHGDLRVPHFLGLHAMQLLPLFALLFARKNPGAVFTASGLYLLVFTVLLVQALDGRPFLGGRI